MASNSQSAPGPYPVRTRTPVPGTVRVYAHLHGGFEVGCPACATVNVIAPRHSVRAAKGRRSGYDPLTGILRCRGCARLWYVGLVLWGLHEAGGGRRTRPADHVPSWEEAGQIRAELGLTGIAKVGPGGRRPGRAPVNRVCWCGQACPLHSETPISETGQDAPGGAIDPEVVE